MRGVPARAKYQFQERKPFLVGTFFWRPTDHYLTCPYPCRNGSGRAGNTRQRRTAFKTCTCAVFAKNPPSPGESAEQQFSRF